MRTTRASLLALSAAALSATAVFASPLHDLLGSLPEPGAALPQVEAPKAPAAAGEALFQQLHAQTAMTIVPQGHAYLDAKKYMFSQADNTGCGGGPGVTCLYSQVCAKGASEHGEDYKEPGDANGDGIVDDQGMNAEHSWPQSFFDKQLPMKSDLHHIFPTFMTPNGARGSMPFGPVAPASAAYSTKSGSRSDGDVYEPADAVKGNIARAILYFVTRYYDKPIHQGVNYSQFWTERVPMFLEWNRKDPPDAAERRRNELIFKYQGNRNPYVDDPALADRVGAQVFQSH